MILGEYEVAAGPLGVMNLAILLHEVRKRQTRTVAATWIEAVKIHFGAACKERAIDFLDQILIRIIKRETSHANKMVQDRSSISLV